MFFLELSRATLQLVENLPFLLNIFYQNLFLFLGCSHRRFNWSNSNLAPTEWLSIFRFRISLALAARSFICILTRERLLLLGWWGGGDSQVGAALRATSGCCTSLRCKCDGHRRVTFRSHRVARDKRVEDFYAKSWRRSNDHRIVQGKPRFR